MNLLADENIDRLIVERLRADSHDVVWICEFAPSTPDPDVLTFGTNLARPVITFDVGIGPLALRRAANPPGVAIFRLRSRTSAELLERFTETWPLVQPILTAGTLVTALHRRVRTRRMP